MQAHTARNFEFSCCLHPWTVHSRFLSSSAATLIGLFKYQTVSVQLHQRPACAFHKNQSVGDVGETNGISLQDSIIKTKKKRKLSLLTQKQRQHLTGATFIKPQNHLLGTPVIGTVLNTRSVVVDEKRSFFAIDIYVIISAFPEMI